MSAQIVPSLKRQTITISRPLHINQARSVLPIIMEEYPIMEKILENQIVLICGETGSGKTTQLPQFLYEYGFTFDGQRKIGITEPRRAAARSMSEVVGEQLCLTDREVSFQTRYEGNVSEATVVKFMTDGILLKEIQSDFMLSEYSVIIVDEAHERSVYSDILLGLLTRIVEKRSKIPENPLRLIIMSATIEYQSFTKNRLLFREIPPVVHISARQFPVNVHFARRTEEDYVDCAIKKVCEIHDSDGSDSQDGILVFVTGRREVFRICGELKRIYGRKMRKRRMLAKEEQDKLSKKKFRQIEEAIRKVEDEQDLLDEVLLLNEDDDHSTRPLHVVPLYAALPSEEQRKARRPPPQRSRLCVVSTNVAEVSLTIPGIKHVVDSGKEKVRVYDKETGSSGFVIRWISKASAAQRTGRAGRVCEGFCHRLYSTAVFGNDFADYSEPEILRRPLEDVILQMRHIGVDVDVELFPYPTPPDPANIHVAEELLVDLGALERATKLSRQSQLLLTPFGNAMAYFPLNPRYAKMLLVSDKLGVFEYASILVSALNSYEYFVDDERNECGEVGKRPFELRREWMNKKVISKNHRILGDLFEYLLFQVNAEMTKGRFDRENYCARFGIRSSAAADARRIRIQLCKIAGKIGLDVNNFEVRKLGVLDAKKVDLLRKVVACGMVDKIARKNPEVVEVAGKKMRNTYISTKCDTLLIHPKSCLAALRPEFLCYQDLVVVKNKKYMVGVCGIEASWLPQWAAKRLYR